MDNAKIFIIERNNKLISVMLDRDLAQFYGIETKRLNELLKNNTDRFEGEVFQLTKEEIERSFQQNQRLTYKPKVYTEVGALTFSGLIKSKQAHEVFKVLLNSFFAFKKIMEKQSISSIDKADLLDLKERVHKIEHQLKFNTPPLYIGTNNGPILINNGNMEINKLSDLYKLLANDIESSNDQNIIDVLNKILEQVSKKDPKVLDTISKITGITGFSGLLLIQNMDKIKDFIVNFIK
jgi:hypothetical protein